MGVKQYGGSIMKKILKGSLILLLIMLLIVVILLTIIALPWLLIYGLGILEPNPPTPEITYGEFPFKLEYRIDDETFVVEDVIICEYDGVRWNEGIGKHRVWKKILKNSGEENLLILTDGDVKIYCNIGKAEYYMNDLKYSVNEAHTPVFYYITSKGSGSERTLLDKYKIELIDWEFSQPIKNSFR